MFSNIIELHISENIISLVKENSFNNVSSISLDYSSLVNFKDINYSYFRMQSLYLGYQKIIKIVENSLKGFYLKIDLSFNLLTSNSIKKDSFGYSPNLKEISFAKNLIEALDFDDAFQFNLTNLTWLDFENNKISTIQNGFFKKLSNLSSILLSFNNFGSLKKDYFLNLESLEYLNLSNNQILTNWNQSKNIILRV